MENPKFQRENSDLYDLCYMKYDHMSWFMLVLVFLSLSSVPVGMIIFIIILATGTTKILWTREREMMKEIFQENKCEC